MSDAVTREGDAEEWRAAVGYEGYYEVSSFGRVRSVSRYINTWFGRRRIQGRVLQLHQADAYGHLGLKLCVDGKVTPAYAHRLVAIAFIGPPPPGTEVCHGPGGKTDNRVSNLRWDTHQANVDDCTRAGNGRGSRTHCPRGHPLAAPNLLRSALARRLRTCFACSRTHTRVNRARRCGVELDFQRESDAEYQVILRTNGAPQTSRRRA